MPAMTGTVVVDRRGDRCPGPLIALARAVRDAKPEQEVVLVADDPAARMDVPVWCRLRHHELLDVDEDARTARFRVRPRAARSARREPTPAPTGSRTQARAR